MKIITQLTSGKLAIGIEGTREEQETLYNRIYNFGGTNGDLHEMAFDEETGEGFAYFVGRPREIFRALVEGIRQKQWLDGGAKKWKKNPRGYCFACMLAAGREMKQWTRENFLPENPLNFAVRRVLAGTDWENIEA